MSNIGFEPNFFFAPLAHSTHKRVTHIYKPTNGLEGN